MGFLQVVPSTSPLNRNLFSQILHFMLKFCPLMLTLINSNVLWGPCVCMCHVCSVGRVGKQRWGTTQCLLISWQLLSMMGRHAFRHTSIDVAFFWDPEGVPHHEPFIASSKQKNTPWNFLCHPSPWKSFSGQWFPGCSGCIARRQSRSRAAGETQGRRSFVQLRESKFDAISLCMIWANYNDRALRPHRVVMVNKRNHLKMALF